LLALGVAALAGCSAPAAKEKLTVGMELAYPPFETKDEAGEPSGVSVDFAKDFAASIGKEAVIENTAWDGLIPSLETGKVDMVISSMTITEERREKVDFSEPYANAYLAVLANSGSGVNSVDDLDQKGKKVAVKTGSTGDRFASKNLTEAEIISLPDESAAVTEVVQGKADGFIYDQLTILRNNAANPDTTKAILVPFQDIEQWGVAVRKGDAELLGQLNSFISKSQQDGEFDRLTEKHLAQEKADFDRLGFKWFFDVVPSPAS
jgi:polar amino acid transport system substrate-binding protein